MVDRRVAFSLETTNRALVKPAEFAVSFARTFQLWDCLDSSEFYHFGHTAILRSTG